jgi:hypothetical protein
VDDPLLANDKPNGPPPETAFPVAPDPTEALPVAAVLSTPPLAVDQDTTVDRHSEPEGPPGGSLPEGQLPDPILKPLEQRVRRLEDALAHLQDPRQRTPAPVAQAAAPPPTARLAPPVPDAAPNLPAAAALVVAGAHLLTGNAPQAPEPRHLWLLFDTIAETRAIVRMFVDPRYKMSWLGRIVPLVLLLAFLTSRFWAPGAPLGEHFFAVIVKAFDLLIGYLLFKVLTYEARRYRQTAPDLPPTLRL